MGKRTVTTMTENELFGNSEQLNDTISRQAAISHVDDVPYIKDHPNVGLLWKAWIESLPSAQPDIIRCPDCYYNDGTAYCELHFRNVKAKDFCSWAERRE